MDRISKALKKLSAKERGSAKRVLLLILNGGFKGLDVKKLRGRRNIFRVRKGRIRVIYKIESDRSIFILAIERRSENTYR